MCHITWRKVVPSQNTLFNRKESRNSAEKFRREIPQTSDIAQAATCLWRCRLRNLQAHYVILLMQALALPKANEAYMYYYVLWILIWTRHKASRVLWCLVARNDHVSIIQHLGRACALIMRWLTTHRVKYCTARCHFKRSEMIHYLLCMCKAVYM